MKASCVPILGILGHVIRIEIQNNIKKRRFLAGKVIASLIVPKSLDVQS